MGSGSLRMSRTREHDHEVEAGRGDSSRGFSRGLSEFGLASGSWGTRGFFLLSLVAGFCLGGCGSSEKERVSKSEATSKIASEKSSGGDEQEARVEGEGADVGKASDPSEQAEAESSLQRAKRLYFEGVAGDGASAREAREILIELEKSSPEDPQVVGYSGSALLFQSATTLLVWRKGKLAKQGLERLDRAVDLASEDPELRFLRGISTFHLPGWFGRREQSEADLRFVALKAEDYVREGRLDVSLAAAALFHDGLFSEKRGDREEALTAWQRAVALGPQSPAGLDAAERLRDSRDD